MKKARLIQLATIALTLLAASCAGGNNADSDKLQQQVDSLLNENQRVKGELDDMTTFIGALSEGLDTIAVLENQLFDSSLEGKGNARELMRQKLQVFSDLLASQRERIRNLNDSLAAKGANMAQMQSLINLLNQQLDQKDQMISELKNELNNKNADIASLRSRVGALSQANAELAQYVETQLQQQQQQQTTDNTVYVVVGSAKALKEAGITSGGGFLSKAKVKADLPQGLFTKKDLRNFEQLEIPSGSAKVVSPMPKGSYVIEKRGKDQSVLTITDPQAFWSQTHYLVVQTK